MAWPVRGNSDMIFGSGFQLEKVHTGDVRINVQCGGSGPPLLLLHGYPQTHAMWHCIAPALAEHFTLICPDLRGYGDSDKPVGDVDHSNYSKRVMAQDMRKLMSQLGHDRFLVAAHDRGARVAHRLMLDHPACVTRGCLMDITPTHHMLTTTDRRFAQAYYHWFFLAQPEGLPERLIGADSDYYLLECLRRWSRDGAVFHPAALAEYKRCFRDPATIHASCEDYRAALHVDLAMDENDRTRRVQCPLLLLWGDSGFVGGQYAVLEAWQGYADDIRGQAVPSGHFIAEESPQEVTSALLGFFLSGEQ